MFLLVKILINGFAVYLAAYFLKEGVMIKDFYAAVVVCLALSLINTFIKPILKILFLPLNFITLGIFNFIVNGFLILIITYFIPGFYIKNIFWAIGFSLVLSLINWLLNFLVK